MKTIYNLYSTWLRVFQSATGITNTGWYMLMLLVNGAIIGGVAFDLFSPVTLKALVVLLALTDSIALGARMYISEKFKENPGAALASLSKRGTIDGSGEDEYERKTKLAVAVINKYGDLFNERMKAYPDAVPGDPTSERVLRETMTECNAELEKLGMSITNVSAMKDDDVTDNTPPTDKRKMH